MQQSLRDKKQSDIFKTSIEMFGRELANFFPDKENVRTELIKSDGDLEDVYKNKQDKDFALPLWTYRITSLDEPEEQRYNKGRLRRQGLVINQLPPVAPGDERRPDDPNIFYTSIHLTPATVSFDIKYYCDFEDTYTFGPMWQQAADAKYLNFEIMLGDKPIAIRVVLNKSVSYDSTDLDNVTYAAVSLSATMETYHGVVSEVRPVMAYKVKAGTIPGKGSPSDEKLIPAVEITKTKERKLKVQVFGN